MLGLRNALSHLDISSHVNLRHVIRVFKPRRDHVESCMMRYRTGTNAGSGCRIRYVGPGEFVVQEGISTNVVASFRIDSRLPHCFLRDACGAMLPTADDFPNGPSAEADECAELLKKVDTTRPIIVQIPESDELLQYLRKHRIGDIRRCLRRIRGARIPRQDVTAPVRPEVRLGDIDRLYVNPGPRCGRPIPPNENSYAC